MNSCHSCGSQNVGKAQYCINCGTKLEREIKYNLIQTIKDNPHDICSVALSEDTAMLACGGWERNKLVNFETGQEFDLIHKNGDYVHRIAFNRESTMLLSWSFDRSLKVWDTSNGADICAFETKESNFTFNANSDQLISLAENGKIMFRDLRTHQKIHEIDSGGAEVFSIDQRDNYLAYSSGINTLDVWDLKKNVKLFSHRFDKCGHLYWGDAEYKLWQLTFNHDSTKLATIWSKVHSGSDFSLRVFDLVGKNEIEHPFDNNVYGGHLPAFGKEDSFLVCVGGITKFWEIQSNKRWCSDFISQLSGESLVVPKKKDSFQVVRTTNDIEMSDHGTHHIQLFEVFLD